jgi:hypothetical protein
VTVEYEEEGKLGQKDRRGGRSNGGTEETNKMKRKKY